MFAVITSLVTNWWFARFRNFRKIPSTVASCVPPEVTVVSPSGLYGGERVWRSKSRNDNVPLQVHQWCVSKELWLQCCSTGQPARRGHPVRSQKGKRVWEEHHQPPSLQVRIFPSSGASCYSNDSQSKDLNLIWITARSQFSLLPSCRKICQFADDSTLDITHFASLVQTLNM